MFYYVMLAMTVAAFVLCHALLKSRVGYYWLAIRESPEAAQALGIDIFRYKMFAVVMSAAMTSLGGVLFAFYYNNLFPEQVFHISRSIELILGPIIGGIGTLFGPIVGAFLLTALAETPARGDARLRHRRSGHQAGVLRHLPAARGHVPARRRVAAASQAAGTGTARRARRTQRRLQMTALLEVDRISKSFSGLKAMQDVSFAVPEGQIVGLIGPNGAGKTTCFNVIAGVYRADAGEVRFAGERIDGWRSDQICRAGVGRTFQLVKPFAGLTVMENVIVGALNASASVREAKERAAAVIEQLGLGSKREQMASSLTLPERKRLEVARALATGPRLLLLDEVMAGLRPTETDHMVALFRELNTKLGLTILLIEHVMRAVMALSSRLIVLHHGQVIASRQPRRGHPRPRRARMLPRRGGGVMGVGWVKRSADPRLLRAGICVGSSLTLDPTYVVEAPARQRLSTANASADLADARRRARTPMASDTSRVARRSRRGGDPSHMILKSKPRAVLRRRAGAGWDLARRGGGRAGRHRRRQRCRQVEPDPHHRRHRDASRRPHPFRGRDITGLPSYRICNLGIGQVAEGRQIFPSLTVEENLQMGALLPRARGAMGETMREVFAMFPRLEERRGQAAGTMSGGEQQMLAIGRCLMGRPELIMFDEPSLGLAPALVQELFRTIRALNQRGLTVLLVEQNVVASLKLAARAYVLENGRIVMAGTGADLLADDRVRQAYLGIG